MTEHFAIHGESFALMQCGECGIRHLMPSERQRESLKLGPALRWHCPNGHERAYVKSEADRARAERDEARAARDRAHDALAAAQERADKAEAKAARLAAAQARKKAKPNGR